MRWLIIGAAVSAAALVFVGRKEIATVTKQIASGVVPPMGVRNHNPLNIRKGNNWKGEVEPDHNRNYEAFESDQYGFRAGARILKSYNKRGLNTLEKIIGVFAPHGDNNDPDHYANMVSKWTGIPKTAAIDVNNADQLATVLQAMARMEVGVKYDYSVVLTGVQMA